MVLNTIDAAVRVDDDLVDIEIEDAVDAPTQTFDLRGQPPAALLDIVARACERAEPGAVIAALVDDESFPERLQQWLWSADATLIDVQRRGELVETRIRVEAPALAPVDLARPAPILPGEPERCTLLVLHDDHEALHAALLVANRAAAEGMDTTVFLTVGGVNHLSEHEPGFMQRVLQWMMPERRQALVSLAELVESAQQLGVRFDHGGVASFVEDARHSAITMVF
jgi:TusA-related sulfurtransferase/predicted peroxiredoxin